MAENNKSLFTDPLSRFVATGDALHSFAPIWMRISQVSLRAQIDHYNAILDQHGTKGGDDQNPDFEIPVEVLPRLARVQFRLNSLERNHTLMSRLFLVGLVTAYDLHVSATASAVLKARPEILKGFEKALSYRDALSFTTHESLQEHLIDEVLDDLTRDQRSNQLEWFKKHLDLTFELPDEMQGQFVELTERRNLYTHTDGVVTEHYLRRCKQCNVYADNAPTLGEPLHSTYGYLRESFALLIEIAGFLSFLAWRKCDGIKKNETHEDSENLISGLAYQMLQEGYNGIAIRLIERLLTYPLTDARCLRCKVNLAQSKKWSGDREGCVQTLEEEDWSSRSMDYQICVAVLKDEFDESARLMRKLGVDGPISQADYLEWPVFREFRETSEFAAEFESIFGDSVETYRKRLPPIMPDEDQVRDAAKALRRLYKVPPTGESEGSSGNDEPI